MIASDYLRHIERLNCRDLTAFLPFMVDGRKLGFVHEEFIPALTHWPDIFIIGRDCVELHPQIMGFESRTAALDRVAEKLAAEGWVAGLQQEPYPLLEKLGEEPALCLDRALISRFGVRAWGQHVNGYVRRTDGLWMWIARRADDRHAFPGRLDQLVAGGLPFGISATDNLLKESVEEAGMSAELAGRACAVGQVSYCCTVGKGLRQDTLLCYDLELPENFSPRNLDGEVASFQLLPVEEVARIVRESDAFKPNCNLVIIDFLIRHGYIRGEEANLLAGLLQAACLE